MGMKQICRQLTSSLIPGEPWHTQKWARAIQEKYYGMGPRDAYPGDEDQGQMSSWYILSSIGLFQMDGGCSKDPVWLLWESAI